MIEMVINGVSTKKIENITEELCGKTFSKSMVSDLCKKLDPVVDAFKNRPLKSKYGMKIENPPFYGHTLRAGLNDTWGGIKINAKAQVIDLDGKPIPGLYACGGCTGGGMYFVPKEKRGTKTIEVVTGVGALAGALTFGRVVGQEIAGK